MLFIALMLLISLSGNYTYFNLLTLILCLTLFENRFYQRLFPGKMISHFENQNYSIDNKKISFTQITVMIIIICLTLITESRRWLPIPQVSIISQASRFIYPYRIVNTYGLFSVMTKTRPEIIFELSPIRDLCILDIDHVVLQVLVIQCNYCYYINNNNLRAHWQASTRFCSA